MAPSIIRPVSPNSFGASKSICSGGVINPSFILFPALMSFLSIIDLFSAFYNAAGGSSYRSCVSRLFPADRQYCCTGGFSLVLCGRSRIITSINLNLVRHIRMINSEKLLGNLSKIIFEKNKNGTITGFKSHTISNEVLDELMPWNENFKK